MLLLLLLLLLQEKEPEKQAAVQAILGLSDGEADNLRAIVAAGGFKAAGIHGDMDQVGEGGGGGGGGWGWRGV